MTGFEKTYLEIQRLGNEYAFENLPELEEQLKEYKQLCIMKAKLEEMISLRQYNGFDVLHIDDVEELIKGSQSHDSVKRES